MQTRYTLIHDPDIYKCIYCSLIPTWTMKTESYNLIVVKIWITI